MSRVLSTQFVGQAILIKGILNTLLGILHILGTFTFQASRIAGQGSDAFRRDYLIWFSGVGGFIVFMGLVDILCYKSLKANMNFAWRIAVLCAVSTTLLGLYGTISFGMSPPVQLLLTGCAGLLVLVLSRREFADR
ncbi:hypothetical protein RA307_20425 [Xanthobacteraceae bacterium Astr-EGSB]|uniref:hypothetical protein n=1 Tax=Astrobacterium formosum TaxID=3069710 RepID=UPI0027B86C85|nr:hypothetical protein [Xanthobacteraceae bacterium Astr-EGSB]